MNMGYTAIFLLPVEPYLHRWILRKHIMRIFYIIYILSFSVKKKNPFVRRYWLLFLCLKNMVESSRVFEEFHSKYDASVVLFSTCWVMTAFFVCAECFDRIEWLSWRSGVNATFYLTKKHFTTARQYTFKIPYFE